MRKLAASLVAALTVLGSLLLIVVPASADVSPGDVEAARQKLREVSERLQGEVANYEQAVADEAILRDRLDRLVVELSSRERELVLARSEARDRAAAMYMSAGAVSTSITVTDDPAGIPARYVYLEAVSQTDRDVVNRLEISRRDYAQHKALVDAAILEQSELRSEMESLVSRIYTELDAANAEYRTVKEQWDAQEAERIRREEEAARLAFLATSTTVAPVSTSTTVPATTSTPTPPAATTSTTTTTTQPTTTTPGETTTTTPPPPPASGMVCPVDGATTFTDTWGAPRPGGREHHGTDMLASRGTPLVAIESGYIWSPNWDADGGLGLYINADDGDTWYYAHLDSYVSGLTDGMRVEAGQRVGFVGQTGNASVPHLHIGWYPGGFGTALANPYPVVAGLC